MLAFVTAPSLIVAAVALIPRRTNQALTDQQPPIVPTRVQPAHIIDDSLEVDQPTPPRQKWHRQPKAPSSATVDSATTSSPRTSLRAWFARISLPTFRLPWAQDHIAPAAPSHDSIHAHEADEPSLAGAAERSDAIERVEASNPSVHENPGDIHYIIEAPTPGPTEDDFARFALARELEEMRHRHAMAELAQSTAIETPALWIDALVPNTAPEDTATRLRAIHHLALLPKNSFAPALLLRALDSEPEPLIRARILGALAKTDSLTDEAAGTASTRSEVEASAILQLRRNNDSQDTLATPQLSG